MGPRRGPASGDKARARGAGSGGVSHPTGPRPARVLLVVLAALLPGACVRYVNVDLDRAPAEEEVRVRLTDDGAVRAARHLGRIVTELDAGVEARPPDSVAVVVWLGKNYVGTQFEDVRETIVFPASEVREIHLRELSPQRTAVALGGAAILFAFMVDQIFLQEDPNRPPVDDRDNPPPASGMTLLRIPIGQVP